MEKHTHTRLHARLHTYLMKSVSPGPNLLQDDTTNVTTNRHILQLSLKFCTFGQKLYSLRVFSKNKHACKFLYTGSKIHNFHYWNTKNYLKQPLNIALSHSKCGLDTWAKNLVCSILLGCFHYEINKEI